MIARLADDDAGAVIDEEAAADLGAGVNVDAGGRVGQLGDDPRHQRRAQTVQHVRQAMMRDRRDAGIADQHLVDAARRGIALERGANIAVQQPAHVGQARGELAHHIDRRTAGWPPRRALHRRDERELAPHLVRQLPQRGIQRVADEVVDAFVR